MKLIKLNDNKVKNAQSSEWLLSKWPSLTSIATCVNGNNKREKRGKKEEKEKQFFG